MAYQGVWILAEQKDGKAHLVSYELLNRGKALAEKLRVPLSAVVLGSRVPEAEYRELIYHGADRVYAVDHPALGHFLAEPYQKVLVSMIRKFKPEIVLAAATTTAIQNGQPVPKTKYAPAGRASPQKG